MVELVHVSKIFDNKYAAVNDVSFKIQEGEFVFLIGPSGSGKTTIIKMLIRDVIPSEGKVFFNDKDITKITRRKVYMLRREIGVIFQDFKLIPEKTAFENVAFAMEAAGRKTRDIKETVPYVLDIVGLGRRINAFPRQLSGGEQQRVAIARAIANNPKILIADEPTGNLDPASSWDIVQILTKINNWGTTVIMSTHGTDIVNSLNKRVIQMDGGRIIRDDNKGQYEMTEKYEKVTVEDMEKVQADVKKSKKKSIQYKMSADEEQEETPVEEYEEPVKKGVFGRLFKKKFIPVNADIRDVLSNSNIPAPQKRLIYDGTKKKPSVDESSEKQEIDSKSDTAEKKPKLISPFSLHKPGENLAGKIDNNNFEEIEGAIKSSAKTPVATLNLSENIISALIESGYSYVEQILEDGAEALEEKINLSKDDMIKIAQEIKKFIKKFNS